MALIQAPYFQYSGGFAKKIIIIKYSNMKIIIERYFGMRITAERKKKLKMSKKSK